MFDPLPVEALFAPDECDAILAAADGFEEAGLVGGRRNAHLRRARIAWLDDDRAPAWLLRRIVEAVAEANRRRFDFAVEGFDERIQIARYPAATEGHFDWHSDVGEGPLARRRKLTLVAQLSDPADYAGGRLELNPDGRPQEAPRARGDAVLFPSFVLHRVTPVTAGERASLTIWAHGPPLR